MDTTVKGSSFGRLPKFSGGVFGEHVSASVCPRSSILAAMEGPSVDFRSERASRMDVEMGVSANKPARPKMH